MYSWIQEEVGDFSIGEYIFIITLGTWKVQQFENIFGYI